MRTSQFIQSLQEKALADGNMFILFYVMLCYCVLFHVFYAICQSLWEQKVPLE